MNYLSAIKISLWGGYGESSCMRSEKWEYSSVRIDCAVECDITTERGTAFTGEMRAYQSKGFMSGVGLPGSGAFSLVQNLFEETVTEVLTNNGCQILKKDLIKLLLIRHEKKELPIAQIFQGVINTLQAKIEQNPTSLEVHSKPLHFCEVKPMTRLETSFSLHLSAKVGFEAIKTNLERYTIKRISRILFQGYSQPESPLNRLHPDVCRIIIALCAERLSPQESYTIAYQHFTRPNTL